jgi:hypothetical protein
MTEQERLEEFLKEMEPLHDAAVAEQERMSAFAKDLRTVIVTQALKHYPQIYDLDSDGFRRLDDRIGRHIDRIVGDVEEIV